jgi:hypothetical protein
MEKLINKIKKNGYWKVIIRPVDFKEDRITDKDTASKIIEDSQIVFRGWDYPHVDSSKGIIRSGPDSVASFCDWKDGGQFEFWKLYLNGQFVHYFSMKEDYRIDEEDKSNILKSFSFSKPDQKIDIFFSIINVLYTITEIFFFAANLAKLADYKKETEINIEIGNVKGRALFFWGQPFRFLSNIYTCEYEPINEKRIVSTEDLISNTAELALDLTISILKEFNWKKANKNIFREDQIKLIEKRT